MGRRKDTIGSTLTYLLIILIVTILPHIHICNSLLAVVQQRRHSSHVNVNTVSRTTAQKLYNNNYKTKLVLQEDDFIIPTEWEDYAPIYRDGTVEPPSHYITQFGRKWTERLEELRKYRAEHGDCMVPTIYEQNQQLANWVGVQRYQYDLYTKKHEGQSSPSTSNTNTNNKSSSVMTEARIEALNAIQFCWGIHAAPHMEWSVRFQQLKQFYSQHGHCNVPKPYAENPALGVWVHTQRTEYIKYSSSDDDKDRDSHLGTQRVEALNGLHFVWSVRDAVWESMYQDLVQYKAKYGDCNVPHPSTLRSDLDYIEVADDSDDDDGGLNVTTLGIWVSTQRADYKEYQQYNSKNTSFKNDDEISHTKFDTKFRTRMERLNQIGFVWDLHEAAWRSMYDALVRYKKFTGDCLVPQKYDANPQLGYWVMNQRQLYRKFCSSEDEHGASSFAGMSKERIEALGGIGFVWSRR